MNRVLPPSFYRQRDVVLIARELLGKVLVTRFDGRTTSGMIIETEAYAGIGDRASHAFGGKRTDRTEVMYAPGGVSYVYLCYGIHHLFNVVTHGRDVPHAVLIRGIEPIEGMEIMRERREGRPLRTNGPGMVTQALGITVQHSGMDLMNGPITILNTGFAIPDAEILIGPRIGVDYAGSDALLPYRFRYAPSRPAR